VEAALAEPKCFPLNNKNRTALPHPKTALIADAVCNFWYFSAPSSLFTCCYLLASAFLRLCWLSHIKLRSGRSADLRILNWYTI
jgi:hypothetical protein